MMASKAKRSPLARGLILVTASTLVIALALGAIWLDGWLGILLPSGLRWPGIVVLICGLALIAWAEVALLRIACSTGAFGDAPGTLVAQGPYRQVRNPIYLGAFGVLLGLSGWQSSPTLMVLALGFLPIMHRFVTRSEEPATRRRLGAQYDDYLRRVPRWLPRLRRRVDGV